MSKNSDIAVNGMLFRISDLSDATIQVKVHHSSHRISARWRNGMLQVTVPARITMDIVINFIRNNKEKIFERRPQLRFHIGQTLQFANFTATISRQSLAPGRFLLHGETNSPRILVADDIDIDTDESTAIISRLLCMVARRVAPSLLLPEAKEISARLRVAPASWSISRGHTILGHCNRHREIALSEVLVFLPQDLREYIICHELAHLSEFNHSPRFHALCDQYLGGREKILITKLKNHKWPIIRK